MPSLDRQALADFIQSKLQVFYERRLESLDRLKLKEVLQRKNPYLFKAKGIQSASDLARDILQAFLSSSEEERFGRLLEEIAFYVAQQVYGAYKSAAEGIDLEFDKDGVRYFVQIKSGTNWGNSAQKKRLSQDFQRAVQSYQHSHPSAKVACVQGSCYGKQTTKSRTASEPRLYTVLAGQAFWTFLSGDPNLYLEIIEPMGNQARTFSLELESRRAALEIAFTREIAEQFTHPDGTLDWQKLLVFVSAAD
jgi:hypothetical protein